MIRRVVLAVWRGVRWTFSAIGHVLTFLPLLDPIGLLVVGSAAIAMFALELRTRGSAAR